MTGNSGAALWLVFLGITALVIFITANLAVIFWKKFERLPVIWRVLLAFSSAGTGYCLGWLLHHHW